MKLNPIDFQQLVLLALREDIGSGDATTVACIPAEEVSTAKIVARQDMVVCGIDIAKLVFTLIDSEIGFDFERQDGEIITGGEDILRLKGKSSTLLKGERTALNFLGHLSGVATLTSSYVTALSDKHTKIVDTRKTIPGFRILEKYAVRCGGGSNHRFGLFDGILLKENHIRAAGGILSAVKACRESAHHLQGIEVEVTNLKELEEALSAKADVVMLDNFDTKSIVDAVSIAEGKALIEVSGNVSLDNVTEYALPGVDFISVGKLTHSAPSADLSMLFDE